MSFSCTSCSKVFGDQVAVSQHFQSVHNKATYQASIRATRGEKQARKARQMEEAKTQANANEGVAGLALSPTTYSNPPIDEIVSQQNFYPETPLSFNGSNLKQPGLGPAFNSLGHDFPERQAPISGTSLDARITPPEPWYKAQENTPWRDSLQNAQENSPWRISLRDTQENPSWRRALRDVEEDSPWSRALRVAEENSRWRMFLQNKGSRATQNTPLPTATNRVPTYENDSLPNGPDTPQGDNSWAKPESFCCKDCKSFFQDQETLDSHITSTGHTMHRVPCFVCHKPFPREQSIDEHLKTVPHNCIYCNLPVQGHNGVAPHLRFSHQFSCSTCGDCLPDSKAQHLHGAHGVTQVVYWCQTCQPSCGQAFSTQEALKAHIRSLTGTPPPSPSPQTTTWHDRDLSQCDTCIPSCKGHFSTCESLVISPIVRSNSIGSHFIEALETNSVSVIKQLPGPRVLAQRAIPATPEKMLMYPCFTCKPPCGGIFDTQEAKEEHLESMCRIPTYKTARRGKFGFLCTKCEPPCKGFFETRESLLTHHRYMEKKVHLEIEALEVGIRSIKEKSRLEIEAIEIQLRSMRETSRLEIEAMNTNLRSMREKLHLDTPNPNKTLPSLACDVCKPFCGSTFETEEALERHLDTIIENAMDTRLTSIKKDLLLNTTNPSETVFPLGCHTCTPPCGSTFNTQESQKDHLELVIGGSQLLITRYSKYQFICNTCDPTCGKIFDSQEALETHVSSMIENPRHNPTDDFPNGGCMPYCNFTSGMNGTHGDSETKVTSIIDSSIDQFPCDKCNPSCERIFDTQNALENHLEFLKERFGVVLPAPTKTSGLP